MEDIVIPCDRVIGSRCDSVRVDVMVTLGRVPRVIAAEGVSLPVR
jgi:hypothetical protein